MKTKKIRLKRVWLIKKRKKVNLNMNDTVKLENKGKTKIIAHRGLSGLETENTASAFVAAGNRSYFGIETDVHKTKDGKFVCIHDENTKRVGKREVSVKDVSYDELKQVKLKDFFTATDGRADYVVPLLEDYINICKKYLKHAVLELKAPFTIEDLKEITDIIKGLDYLNNVTFISFIPENLIGLRRLLPNQPIMALTDRMNDEIFNFIIDNNLGVDVHHLVVNEEFVERFHNKGMEVNVWTVDNKSVAEKLIEWGVDYITTNILE